MVHAGNGDSDGTLLIAAVIGWSGMTGGGRSAVFFYPDDDLAVIVLTNLAGALGLYILLTVCLSHKSSRASGGSTQRCEANVFHRVFPFRFLN